MNWIVRNKFALLAWLVFFTPALIVPAIVHDRNGMRAWMYFAWIFASPLAAFIATLKRPRKLVFYLGLASFLVPIDIIWYLAFVTLLYSPDREKVAEVYLPILMIALMLLIPLGFFLTVKGTQDNNLG